MSPGRRNHAGAAVVAVLALMLALVGCTGRAGGDAATVRIGVGGQPLLAYLPATLADRLGYYKDEGLDVRLEDLQAGSKALQALQGGSVDVVSGYYDHTIQMQAKGRELTSFVNMLRYPSVVLAVSPKASRPINSIADLQGAKVGVTAPGSSTDFFLKYLLVRSGLKADAASVAGIGGGSTAVAAMENGQVDAAVMVDPSFSLLTKRAGADKVRILSDTRNAEGVRDGFGVTTYPASVLYSSKKWLKDNEGTTRKLAKAMTRTLRWIEQHSVEEIADRMPEQYANGDRQVYVDAIAHAKSAYNPDGRVHEDGANEVLTVLSQFQPDVAEAKIELSKTYTNDYLP
ncbi:ABC transporter substrate-binding protein [Longimycelium tulufanense]|uniref:ABC transporter substrate-binding protein n=1 Tax=Longimycelium tulufanense TaxID=907463 RepID=A0A8J3CI66_9PSEU|nr:ABC transporter substrate-binding protein [Longimycelium tulufanense]GGM70600.1 ABC transporter substrate-binding protein [Longimycelium tulufanense]